MFENINKACDTDRPVQAPAASPDPKDLQTAARAAPPPRRNALPEPPKASRLKRAGTAAIWSPPDSQTPEKLKHKRALDTFRTLPKHKLPKLELPAGSRVPRFKRGQSVVDSEEHNTANTLSAAELQRNQVDAADFAEPYPPLWDRDDESGPESPPKRPRTKSPKGKGRAGPVAVQPVQTTASDEDDEAHEDQAKLSTAASPCTKSPKGKNRANTVQQSAHEGAAADPYDFSESSETSDSSESSSSSEDECEEQNEQVAGAGQDGGDSDVDSDADETIVEPMDRAVAPKEQTTKPDHAFEDDVTKISTVDANVPAAKTKKQKRKRTAEPDVELALPGPNTSYSSSRTLDHVQSPLKKLKKNKKSKGDDVATTSTDTGEGSSDLPAAESSTPVASADQQSLPAKKKQKKDKNTDVGVDDIPAGGSSASATVSAESALSEKKKGRKSKTVDTSVNADTVFFVESPAESSADAQRRHKLEVEKGKKRKITDERQTAQQAQSGASGEQPSQDAQAEKKVKKSKKKATSSHSDPGTFVESLAESSDDAQRRHKLEVKNGKKKSTRGDEAGATAVESQTSSSADVLGPLEASLAKQAKSRSVRFRPLSY